jgi:hypothetical protein
MFKKLFGFIGRKKRINAKLSYINSRIDLMQERKKIDFVLALVTDVVNSRNNRELEKILDFFKMELPKALE